MLAPVGDTIIYSDPLYYSGFPSVVCRPSGELIVALRRAPDRSRLYVTSVAHCDRDSYLVLVRSQDRGQTWSHEPHQIVAHPLGGSQDPCLHALHDSSLLPSSCARMLVPPQGVERGLTWAHLSTVARDHHVVFKEASLIETPKRDLVAFIRTANLDDHRVIARSRDRGRTLEPRQGMGIAGHPYYVLSLPHRSVLLVYGYRHPPYGIRARRLDAECRALGTEIDRREDGGSADLGYPWACAVGESRFLVVYYVKADNGTRHIASTFLDTAPSGRP